MRLPKYAGSLAPAPWSGIRFSTETVELLKKAADPKCPACAGAGYVQDGQAAEIHQCHCVNRPIPPKP